MPYYEANGQWGILKIYEVRQHILYPIDMICYYFNRENNEENLGSNIGKKKLNFILFLISTTSSLQKPKSIML